MLLDLINLEKKGHQDRSELYGQNTTTDGVINAKAQQNLKVSFIVFGLLLICLIIFAFSREIYLIKVKQRAFQRAIIKAFKKLKSQETQILEAQKQTSKFPDLSVLSQVYGANNHEEQIIPQTIDSERVAVNEQIQAVPKFPDIA